jgi:hypothetical protein
MEVSKEIAQICKDKDSVKIICENLELEQKEISRKLYFFRVIDLAQQVGELIEKKTFEYNHIEYIKFFVSYDENVNNKIYLKFYDRECENEDTLACLDNDLDNLSSFMLKFNGFNVEDTGSVFNNLYGFTTIKLNNNYKQQIFDAFFSDELKLTLNTTINYVQLTNDLIQTPTEKNKKLKV